MSEKNLDKIPVASIKRPTKKKPKDKPKRPLSAYNYFFKEERQKILKIVQNDDTEEVKKLNDPKNDDYIDEEMVGRLKKEGGKVSFDDMGKLIGSRWKNIDPDRLSKYSEMASEDAERYKEEMKSYNSRQEEKMRNEAVKPANSPDRGRHPHHPYPEYGMEAPGGYPMGYPPEMYYGGGYGYPADPYGGYYGGYAYPPPPMGGGGGGSPEQQQMSGYPPMYPPQMYQMYEGYGYPMDPYAGGQGPPPQGGPPPPQGGGYPSPPEGGPGWGP